MSTRIYRSKATNAYDLVTDVIAAVLQEPRRLNMGFYLSDTTGENDSPACGTVGCFAGWAIVLRFGRAGAFRQYMADNEELWDAGERLLSGGNRSAIKWETVTYTSLVFSPDARLHVFSGLGDDIKGKSPGTPEYADAVAGRLRHFQEVNATALQAVHFNLDRQ